MLTMAAERNITIYKGDSYTHQINIKNSSNIAINITGRSYSSQIRKAKSSESIVATFSTTITDASNGVLMMSLASGQTSGINTGIYYYDLQETNGSIITTLIGGKVTVTGEVSRG